MVGIIQANSFIQDLAEITAATQGISIIFEVFTCNYFDNMYRKMEIFDSQKGFNSQKLDDWWKLEIRILK